MELIFLAFLVGLFVGIAPWHFLARATFRQLNETKALLEKDTPA